MTSRRQVLGVARLMILDLIPQEIMNPRERFGIRGRYADSPTVFDGLEFVTPEQIQELAVPLIAHRLVMEPQARFSGLTARSVVDEAVKKLKVPA